MNIARRTAAYRRWISLLGAVGFALSGAAGCSGGGGDSKDGAHSTESDSSGDVDPLPADADTLRVTTFNAGLLPYFVVHTDERVQPVATAVANHDSDVVCLEEIWRPQDQAVVRSAISGRYPYVYVPEARQKLSSLAPVCQAGQLEPVAGCLISECLLSGVGVFECLLGTCHDELNQLAAQNPECAEAITALQGKSVSDLLDIQKTLFSGSTHAGLFAVGGSSGLMLASRLPLDSVQLVDFFDISTTSRRAAILATVTKNGVQHRVGCTHLQSGLDGLIPYTGQFGSYAGEQRAQAETLLQASTGSASAPVYLAGDFNCSRANSGNGVIDELGSNCQLFADSGYHDPAGDQLHCTFCADNHLNIENAQIVEARDSLLDHVFLKNELFSGARAARVFTESISIGGTAENLSDHYGVQVTIPVP